MPGAGRPPEPDWRTAVTVREDPELTELLRRRRPSADRPPSVSVTDLLDLRRAYWRPLGPAAIPPERQARLDTGRFLHRVLGPVLAPGAKLEVRVRKDGLVGRLDALTAIPVEVKTATLAVEPALLPEDRPEYVEQLAMYCALLGRSSGRLITLVVRDSTVANVRVVDLEFHDLAGVAQEMARRAETLRAARQRKDPSALARCRWFDRGCEFRTAGLCDCTGAEEGGSSLILDRLTSAQDRPEDAQPILDRLLGALATARPPSVERFRDLLYPRRAYFERTKGPAPATVLPAPPGRSTYGDLVEAVESGPVGEVARLPPLAEDPAEEVGGFRDDPYLIRTSRRPVPHAAEDVVGRSPQYALELGFRCVATGRSRARLFVGYESVADEADRFRAFTLGFAPVSVFARIWRNRAAAFGHAVATADPDSLDPCPSWMFESCPYRTDCRCGASADRSQR